MNEQHVTVSTVGEGAVVELMVTPDELDFLWRLDQFGLITLGEDHTK